MKRNTIFLSLLAAAMALQGNAAWAQVTTSSGSGGIASQIVQGICAFMSTFVGNKSQVLSVVFLVALGVMVFLWWLNENKEGVMIWVLRTGIVLAVLINLFTLPPMIGLPAVCS